MAPLTRCRNFNSDGTVRQPCHFGKSCSYIHPDDPRWDSARNSNSGRPKHHDSRGPWSAQGGREGRSNSSIRGAQKSSTLASIPTDHGWGLPHKQAQGQLENLRWGSSKASVDHPVSLRITDRDSNTWGASSSKITSENRDTQGNMNYGWGTVAGDRDKGESKENASKDDTSGWGASFSTSGNWGSSDTAISDKGWGSRLDRGTSGGGWPKDKMDKTSTAGSGWGPSTKDSSSETNIGDRGWNTGTNDCDTRTKPSDPRRPSLPALGPTVTDKPRFRSSTPQPALSPMTAPPLPKLPLPGQKSSSSTLGLLSTTDKKSSDIDTSLKIKTKGINLSESEPSGIFNSANSARSRETHLTRSRIQLNMIKYTLQAVRLQLELNDAQADVERWKRLRSSAQFNRATPRTQTIINEQRLVYGQNVKELENQLHATIRYLSDLPELTTHADLLSTEADEQDLVGYIAQLRGWIGSLKALYRASPPPEIDSSASSTATEQPMHPNEIVWDRIETLVQSVDDNMSYIEDVLYANKDIRADAGSIIADLRDDHDAKRLSEAKENAEKSFKEAQQIGFELNVLIAETSNLLLTVHNNGLALQNLNSELDDCQRLVDYLQQLEQWKEEDSARIERLKQQIKSLHIKKRPTRIPFDQEELKEQIKKSTLKKMTEQVNSLFHTIQEAAKDNSQTFASEILKQLDPILEVTNEVCRRAEAITSRLPMPS
ncbi:hypothetical protein H2248_001183 [Termitomyces sp. 'cryptogamus']|nr:hypothetical protein H2248_001183 [Termitomyces sp. 'cryptogamus']